MIKKKLLLSFIFLSFFCLSTLTAQTKKGKQPLIEILEELHSRFECNFSYIDNVVIGISVEPLDTKLNLKQAVDYLQTNTPLQFTVLGENFIAITLKKGNFSICGYLIDISSNETIQGVVVQTKNISTISDKQGYFKLDRVTEEDIVNFRHLGYKMFTEYAKTYNTKQCETIYLTSKTEDLTEIILSSYLTNGINKIIDGSISINYKNFGAVPGLIETDVLQTIQALSGFQSIDETVSNINVRGGTHDQNLILWDGIKMYQAGHFFGLISALNPRITKRVTLIKNGSAASYTDGISGTIDMKTDYTVNKDLNAEVGLNFINADVFIDLPINKNSSVQLASRKSFSEYLNTPTYNQYFDRAFQNTDVVTSTNNTNSTNEEFDFYDVSLRWLYNVTENDQIRINFLNLDNTLTFTENAFGGGLSASRPSSLNQSNIAGGIHYDRKWNDNFKTSVQLYGSNYNLDAKNFDIINEKIITQNNEIIEAGLHINSSYTLNDHITLNNGYHFTETEVINIEKVNFPVVDNEVRETIQTHGLFSDIGYSTEDFNTHIKFGVRLNYINAFKKFIVEPRLSLNHRLTDKISLEILGEFKNQVTTLQADFRNGFLGLESRRWTLANNNDIPILKSKQISIGSNYNYKGLMISTDFYYKKVDGITPQSQNFQNQYEFTETNGSYNVKGFDFIINNKFNKFNTWLSYSLADNNYVFNELDEKKFPSNFDITHTVSLATAYDLKNLKVSAGFNWRSGRPITKPVAGNEIINNIINYNAPNSSNLNSYMRLDASAIYDFKISKKIKAQAGLSVLNVLDKKNIINIFYSIDDDTNTIEDIEEFSLGITPNVAFRVFF
ncbi:MAG: TonB-dependent receptor plug domain-containing protein [Flavobacteriaceae bacterium]|nr:TonB-dependent receptor plug domain-containing protein [Flavobacteriaceae bacterium]